MSSVRVLIVDDHAVVRAGPAAAARRARTTSSPSARPAPRATRSSRRARSKPDVILLDVVMPDQSGLEVVPTLLHEHPETKVLVLSMQDDPQYVREAFAAGASGYVLKEAADTRGRRRDPRGRRRRPLRPPGARRAPRRRRDGASAPRRGGSALGARARGAAAARARPHEPGDREAALHLGAHGRDAPRAHHAEAPALEPRRARPLRARPGPARRATRERRRAARRRPFVCDGGASTPSRRLPPRLRAALQEAERGLRALERAADREDREADAREQEGDADDDAERARAARPCSSC